MTIKNKEQIQEVIDIIQKDKITIDNIHIKDLKDGNTHLLELNVSVDFRRRTTQLYYSVSEIPGVENVEIESL